MPPRVSTGDRDAVLRQIRWCAAVQTLTGWMPFLLPNQQRHCKLKENLVRNVEPMQLVVQNGRPFRLLMRQETMGFCDGRGIVRTTCLQTPGRLMIVL